ncbi:DUF1648 domain-containing protein [Bacillaceae bacterium W0354]
MKKGKDWTKVLAFFSIVLLVAHLVHLIYLMGDIPDRIAIHFTNEEPDRWGSKYLLLIMPVIGFLVWWLLGKLAKHPNKLNYINLTEENRDKQYRMASKITAILQNLSLLTFLSANEEFLSYAIGTHKIIYLTLTIILLVLALLVVIYNLIWAARLKN